MPRVLITGASSEIGSEILHAIVEGQNDVVAGVDGEKPLNSATRSKLVGACKLPMDSSSLDFTGIDYLVIVPSDSEKRVQHVRSYIDAAKRADVKFILLQSVLGAQNKETEFAKQYRQMEVYLINSAIRATFLRPTWLMENLLIHADSIRKEGVIKLPLREGKIVPISVIDIAKFVRVILDAPEKFVDQAYDLLGPNSVSGVEIASAASESLGLEIRYVNVSSTEYKIFLKNKGLSEWQIQGILEDFDPHQEEVTVSSPDDPVIPGLVDLQGQENQDGSPHISALTEVPQAARDPGSRDFNARTPKSETYTINPVAATGMLYPASDTAAPAAEPVSASPRSISATTRDPNIATMIPSAIRTEQAREGLHGGLEAAPSGAVHNLQDSTHPHSQPSGQRMGSVKTGGEVTMLKDLLHGMIVEEEGTLKERRDTLRKAEERLEVTDNREIFIVIA
ncbi:hypothetical protein HDU93_006210 [Gonapodya sp. JEL0774]|nr:hypothetical protein HDU93_006210 [Gonapodya sp. JEL0774]